MLYKLLRGNHSRPEDGAHRIYRPGQEIELSDAEAARLGDRVRLVETRAAATAAEEPGVLDGNVGAVRARLAAIQDADLLAELYEAESDGKGRVTVLDAIERRINQLEE